ncbi:MAG: ABC transporter ATP-binding protein [Candidatus Heimdallarchaeota archaeon]|nr:ABC transporter ATP-binding protein [Candidatus Heimdallarchaeota archaeon]
MQNQDNKNLVPTFHCSNLNKEFSSKEENLVALADLNFSVFPGEFVCVVGPSGCGKSTLLRIIAGLISKTSGEVNFGHVNEDRSYTAMVFQSQGLFPWMTVLENAALGLEMQGVSKQERYQQTIAFLEKVGLKGFIKAYPHTLSGGMRQRVAIARAFLTNPEILLMDEPFGMLDAQTRVVMQEELLALWQEHKSTVVYITHDIEEAIFLGDRILVMSGRPGRLLEDLPVSFSRPRERTDIISRSTEIRLYIWNMLREEVVKELGDA